MSTSWRVFAAITVSAIGATVAGQMKAGLDAAAGPAGSAGGIAGSCTPSTGPDVIVADLPTVKRWGIVGDKTGYSVGTTSCNIGDTPLNWHAGSVNHPVIAQNLYRYHDGRFEQLGYSWLKHGFSALTGNVCCPCQNPGTGALLGVGCSDPYSSNLNGDQDGVPGECGGSVCGGLGPRYEVNPTTGVYSWPYADAGATGDALYKRAPVLTDDVDPGVFPGAKLYAEGQYVAADDAAAGNHHNNVSFREYYAHSFDNGWILLPQADTVQQTPAIYAWQANDPQVVIEVVEDDDDPGNVFDGRFHVGYRVTDNGDGTWHYEYALHNMNSDRAARSFMVPAPAGVIVTNAAFRDLDYHSGDGEGGVDADGTDWTFTRALGEASWGTDQFVANANANAVRWGMMYNFGFDADAPPVATFGSIGLYKPGTPGSVQVPVLGPQGSPCPWDCGDGNGQVDTADFLNLLGQWGQVSPCDFDGDGVGASDFLELLAHWGPCPLFANCGGIGGGCFEGHAAAGCNVQGCCETICAIDSSCCDTQWTQACADMALTECGGCGEPGAGDCFFESVTPGCDDYDCCEIVCNLDPICCTVAWDLLCVTAAFQNCPQP